MNIENIRAFLEVTSAGSFQQAASNLHITQSAMSARIKNLEELLNRQLFNRKRNGVTLTAGGQTFYKHAQAVVRTWELARQETALSEGMKAMVGLGVQLNHWKSTAAPWLQWMKTNAPDVATQIKSDYSDRLMPMLRNGLINVAVLYEPQRNPDLTIEKYAEEKLILVSSVAREVQQSPIEGYIFVDWGTRFRQAHHNAYPNDPSHQITVALAAVGLNHILEQGGSGYFLENEVQEHLASGRLYKVDGAEDFSLTTYLAYFAEAAETPSVQTALLGLNYLLADHAA